MKKMFDNDDEILGVMKKEGLLRPSADFTSQVMKSVEGVSRPVAYTPLLSKIAWYFLIAGFIVTILVCWQVMADSSKGYLAEYNGILDRIGNYLNKIDFRIEFDPNALLIITLAILSMGMLLLVDLWLSKIKDLRSKT